MRTSYLLFNTDSGIILLVGCTTGLAMVIAGAMALKWMVFIILSFVCLSVLFVISEREKFFLYFFFFSLPLGLNFYPIHIPPDVWRPLNGIAINLFDIPLFFLFVSWGFRLVMESDQNVRFYPSISIPFLLIWALSWAGIGRSFAPTVVKLSSLWAVFECWLVFFYLANNLKERKTIYYVVAVMLSTLVLQAMIGFAQKLTGGHLGIGIFGEAAKSFSEIRAGATAISRVGGTFGSPNRLAGYIGLILPTNFALLFAPIDHRYKFTLLLPIFLTASILELITFSRGGWIGLFAGGSITLYWCLLRLIRRKVASLVLLAIFLITFSLAIIGIVKPVRSRLFEDDYGAAYSRIPMVTVAANAIRHNPWLGVGLANYTGAATRYDTSSYRISHIFPWPVHNEFFLLAAELGLPALSLFLFILIVVSIQLIRIGRSHDEPVMPYIAIGLFGGLVTWCVHHQFEFTYVIMFVTLWAYVGLIQAMNQMIKTSFSKVEQT